MSRLGTALKSAAQKVLFGFLFGVGLAGAFFLFSWISMRGFDSDFGPELAERNKTASGQLTIVEHADVSVPTELRIIGTVLNAGSEELRGVGLEAEFFLEGKFVDECGTYLRGVMKPSQSENFKITCGGCPGYEVPQYDEYTVKVADLF